MPTQAIELQEQAKHPVAGDTATSTKEEGEVVVGDGAGVDKVREVRVARPVEVGALRTKADMELKPISAARTPAAEVVAVGMAKVRMDSNPAHTAAGTIHKIRPADTTSKAKVVGTISKPRVVHTVSNRRVATPTTSKAAMILSPVLEDYT